MDIDAPIFALIDARLSSPEDRGFYRQLLISTRHLADEYDGREEYLNILEGLVEDYISGSDTTMNILKLARLWIVLRRQCVKPTVNEKKTG